MAEDCPPPKVGAHPEVLSMRSTKARRLTCVEPLNVRLQPLKFMEFSLEQRTQTGPISGKQVVLVNVPSPMRYALHKLVIVGEREEAFRTKRPEGRRSS